MGGSDYNKKDHYGPYDRQYYPSYHKGSSGNSSSTNNKHDKRVSGDNNSNRPGSGSSRSYNNSGSHYGPKRSFTNGSSGTHFSDSYYNAPNSSFPKRKYNTHNSYNPSRSRNGASSSSSLSGSVYIKRNSQQDDDPNHYPPRSQRNYDESQRKFNNNSHSTYRKHQNELNVEEKEEDYRRSAIPASMLNKSSHEHSSNDSSSQENFSSSFASQGSKMDESIVSNDYNQQNKTSKSNINESISMKSELSKSSYSGGSSYRPKSKEVEIANKTLKANVSEVVGALQKSNDLVSDSNSVSSSSIKERSKSMDSQINEKPSVKRAHSVASLDKTGKVVKKVKPSSDLVNNKKSSFVSGKKEKVAETEKLDQLVKSKSTSIIPPQSKTESKDKRTENETGEKKKPKVKEIIKKIEVNKDPKKKHSLFTSSSSNVTNKPKIKASQSAPIIKKFGSSKEVKKSPNFKRKKIEEKDDNLSEERLNKTIEKEETYVSIAKIDPNVDNLRDSDAAFEDQTQSNKSVNDPQKEEPQKEDSNSSVKIETDSTLTWLESDSNYKVGKNDIKDSIQQTISKKTEGKADYNKSSKSKIKIRVMDDEEDDSNIVVKEKDDSQVFVKISTPIETTSTNPEILKNAASDNVSPAPSTSSLRDSQAILQPSSPLSEIGASQELELDDKFDTKFSPKVSKEKAGVEEFKDIDYTSGEEEKSDEPDKHDDGIKQSDDDSDAETVIADYPPKSRKGRGRGRLVRKSEFDVANGINNNARSHSRSGERSKTSTNNSSVNNNSKTNRSDSRSAKKTRTGRDASGRSKLQRACDKGKYDIAKELLDDGADVNDTDYAGNSSLHEAALKGHYDIVKLLIEHGADVNIQSGPEDLDTPLIDAAANGHLDVVKLLLDNGANPNIYNAQNENIYQILEEMDEPESKDLLSEILEKRDHFKESNPAATSSTINNHPASGDDGENDRNDMFWVDLTSKSGRNEIYSRAAEGDYVFVGKYLSGGGSADTDILIVASRHGHADIVSILLGFGAEVNGVAKDGTTALMHAVGRRNLSIVKLLLSAGADPTKRRKNDGKNCLQICEESLLAEPEEISLLKSKMESHEQTFEESSKLEDKTDGKMKKNNNMGRTESNEGKSKKKVEVNDNKSRKKSVSMEKSDSIEHKAKKRKLDSSLKEKFNKEVKSDDNNDRKKSISEKSKPKDKPTREYSFKTSKLFGGNDDHEENRKGNDHGKKTEDLNKDKEKEKQKELYEQQKAEKIRARQQAVLLKLSQAEKQREEEKRKLKLQEEERKRKAEEELKRKAEETRQQLLKEEMEKEIELKKQVRDCYPYCLQMVEFFDYNCELNDLSIEVKQKVEANFQNYLPLYFVEINGDKYVIDLQVNLITSLPDIYSKFPKILEKRILIEDKVQEKLWNFFNSILVKSYPNQVMVTSLSKRIEYLSLESKRFQSLVLHWIKLSVVDEEIFKKFKFLSNNVMNNLIEIDYSFLTADIKPSIDIPTIKNDFDNFKPLNLKNIPKKFQRRTKVLNVLNNSKKKLW